jgi:YesN/AraC family two-component response regulator
MQKNSPIQCLTLEAMLSDLNYEWHSVDYYIAPDKPIHKPTFSNTFRPDFYGLILCVNGWMDLEINGECVRIEKHCFFAGSPEMIFKRLDQSSDCINKTLFFTKDFLLKNYTNIHLFDSFHFFYNNSNIVLRLTEKEAEPLINLYDLLMSKREKKDSGFHLETIRNLIFSYVYETALVYEQRGQLIPNQYTRESDLYTKFRSLVANYYKEQHTLKFYADCLFISTPYLNQAIKKISGKTPGEIIDESLITLAKVLLKDFSLSIADVAEKLHFSDLSSFSKYFKKHTGSSPLNFRVKI